MPIGTSGRPSWRLFKLMPRSTSSGLNELSPRESLRTGDLSGKTRSILSNPPPEAPHLYSMLLLGGMPVAACSHVPASRSAVQRGSPNARHIGSGPTRSALTGQLFTQNEPATRQTSEPRQRWDFGASMRLPAFTWTPYLHTSAHLPQDMQGDVRTT